MTADIDDQTKVSKPHAPEPRGIARPTRPEGLERNLLALTRKHKALNEQIDRHARTNLISSSRLTALKRMRLALKDRIVFLLRQASGQPA